MNNIYKTIGASFFFLMSNWAYSTGGYLYCTTKNPMVTNTWKYAGAAPAAFIDKYGERSSSDHQAVKTAEDVNDATYIYTKWPPFIGNPVPVAGYSPRHRSDAIQGDYLTFSNQANAKAFCDELVKICQQTAGNDYFYVGVARGANADFWAPISVNYFDDSYPSKKIVSAACPNKWYPNFPNIGGYNVQGFNTNADRP